MIPKLKEIAIAWIRSVDPTPEQAAIARARLDVCEPCEEKTWLFYQQTFVCGACGCPIKKKIFSPEGRAACPRGKWIE